MHNEFIGILLDRIETLVTQNADSLRELAQAYKDSADATFYRAENDRLKEQLAVLQRAPSPERVAAMRDLVLAIRQNETFRENGDERGYSSGGRIPAIRAARNLLGLGLKDAKDLIDRTF